ncbi:MAG: hypothetical protein OXQ94_13875 [Gemmatimonadota bacterium]|nr:hypothetical protein [Gemmatimonadota bacterium]MDE2872764.1 hypothetical protein [Gemmatimonadota bacterium]
MRCSRRFFRALPLLPPLLLAATLHGAASAQPPDPLPPDPAGDAYLDGTARRLVLGARAARDTSRHTIDAYTAVIRERVGVEAPSFRRDRPWVSGERAVRVRWSREEPNVAHVLGARLRHPGTAPGDSEFFFGLRSERYAADPLGDPFNFGVAVFTGTDTTAATLRSPLQSGSEQYYQYRSGDTLTVRFADGRIVQAVAVTAIPRYRSIRLVSAILWIDPESFAVARVAYRLAKKIDREAYWHVGRGSLGLWIRSEPDSGESASGPRDSLPGLLGRLVSGAFNNAMPRVEMDITTVVADYGLWEMRHWLPRSVRWKGYAGVNEGINATGAVPPDVPMTIDWTLEIEEIRERGADAVPGMPESAAEALRLWRREGDSIGGDVGSGDPAETVTITPADREALAVSDLLPPTLWDEDRSDDEAILAGIASELEAIGTGEGGGNPEATGPWYFQPPGKTLRLLRYNPVERVALGTRLGRDFGWGTAVLTSRIGTARLEAPDIDLTLLRDHPRRRVLVSFYRALRGVSPGGDGDDSPGFYESGDASDFHWSHGAAVRILPASGDRNRLSLRLFAEHDTDIGSDTTRNRAGASLRWRPWWGGARFGSVGGGGSARVKGSVGDNAHVKALVEGVLVVPVPGPDRMSLGLQAGAARIWGDPARQDLWRIGAAGDWLRGHEDAVRAPRIAMGRADLQRALGFLRLSIFGDWARAGGEDHYAVGAGLVFMDGVLRLDVARGIRGGREGGSEPVLRVHLLGDAFF